MVAVDQFDAEKCRSQVKALTFEILPAGIHRAETV
jgi:hypothetical protein